MKYNDIYEIFLMAKLCRELPVSVDAVIVQ
jgi:hypothetical protein